MTDFNRASGGRPRVPHNRRTQKPGSSLSISNLAGEDSLADTSFSPWDPKHNLSERKSKVARNFSPRKTVSSPGATGKSLRLGRNKSASVSEQISNVTRTLPKNKFTVQLAASEKTLSSREKKQLFSGWRGKKKRMKSATVTTREQVPSSSPKTTTNFKPKTMRGNLRSNSNVLASVSVNERLAQNQEQLRKQRKKVGFFTVTGLGVLLFFLWTLFFSPLLSLNVNQISVQGATAPITTSEIKNIISHYQGRSLLRITEGALNTDLQKKQPWVKSVTMQREWPHGLAVKIVARKPVAQTNNGKLVDNEGVVLPPGNLNLADFPLLKVDCSAHSSSRCYQQATKVLQILPPEIRQKMTDITVPHLDNVTISLSGGRKIIWGSPEHSDKKLQVISVLMQRPAKIYNLTDYVHPTIQEQDSPETFTVEDN